MSKHIHNLIGQGEHQQLDFKFEISDSRKIARTLSAFSNTDGGTLLIGVKDNGVIAGVRSDEEFYMVEAAASMYCRPSVEFETKEWEIQGKTLLEVIIPRRGDGPFYAMDEEGQWKAYIRVKDQNLLANAVLLKVWRRKQKARGSFMAYTETESFLLAYLEKHPQITINRFRREAQIPKHIAEKVLVNLISMGILNIEITEKGAFYALKEGYDRDSGRNAGG
jgi:predicted HTH transcriptional regulator